MCQWYEMVYSSCLLHGHGRLSAPFPLGIFYTNALLMEYCLSMSKQYNTRYSTYVMTLFCCLILSARFICSLQISHAAETETGLEQTQFSPDCLSENAILVSKCSEEYKGDKVCPRILVSL